MSWFCVRGKSIIILNDYSSEDTFEFHVKGQDRAGLCPGSVLGVDLLLSYMIKYQGQHDRDRDRIEPDNALGLRHI